MRPTLRQLEVLVAVADEGSLAAAAAHLGLDQSSVSRAIAELQQALGRGLVVRGGRSVPLTAAGFRVLAGARQALRLVDGLRDEARPGAV